MEHIVIDYFRRISQIPRCSKNVEGINNYIKNEAKKFGYPLKKDSIGNIVVKVKSNGIVNSEPIILQAHTDMVCEKNEDVVHDFKKDPIHIIENDGYLVASGTTLGADDGIGVAMMLAIMSEANSFRHPELELLFTVDEEIGLIGAIGLDPSLCSGKMLINLDGEEEGYFLVGCAGSRLVNINFKPKYRVSKKNVGVEILFTGLKGGHSGADIHIDLGNSLKLMFFALSELRSRIDFDVEYISGGDKSNAIPREAKSFILIDPEDYVSLEKELGSFKLKVKRMYTLDCDFKIKLKKVSFSGIALENVDQDKILNMGMAFLHGVQKVEDYGNRLIRTSLNFASLLKLNDEYQFVFTIRSLLDIEKEYVFSHLRAISGLAGARFEIVYDYPAWNSNKDSKLVNHLKSVYKGMYLEDPRTIVIHAGLETGIISSKFGGIDSVTIGPWIEAPHTPRERVNIESTIRVYNFLKTSLDSM
ncbi:beta-Ala-His dipeptidase [Borrelia sp. P9F1]|uniref:beta-Ala-His dipeptidase n=1 Tax=Borrelia sp. P9F1 TaxID=3058374 RepID=UPI00264827F6|nr:beta-Ala-His dipeptidase [Borrelia sp. P9F1]WKC58155.1 beta-Ala-His dipeptidase [Borrelia sp. P9F1]